MNSSDAQIKDETEKMAIEFGPLPKWDVGRMKKPKEMEEGIWAKYLRFPEKYRTHKGTIIELKKQGFTDIKKLLDEWQYRFCNTAIYGYSGATGCLDDCRYTELLKTSLKQYSKDIGDEEEIILLILAASARYWRGMQERIEQRQPGEALF
ncbi:Uncharacterised protein [uncultured archaeon]|nr:Uncharacterised protein [uncultured archaeon]